MFHNDPRNLKHQFFFIVLGEIQWLSVAKFEKESSDFKNESAGPITFCLSTAREKNAIFYRSFIFHNQSFKKAKSRKLKRDRRRKRGDILCKSFCKINDAWRLSYEFLVYIKFKILSRDFVDWPGASFDLFKYIRCAIVFRR